MGVSPKCPMQLGDIETVYRLGEEPRRMVSGYPLSETGRQQKGLILVTGADRH